MPSTSVSCAEGIEHNCVFPTTMKLRRPGAKWTCGVCRREWVAKGDRYFESSNEGVGVPSAVVMRYPDGTEKLFAVRPREGFSIRRREPTA